MTRLAVTGATGQLGRLTIAHLLEAGTAPSDIVAIVRDVDKAASLATSGVQVRVADYTDPGSLATAFVGVDRLLLISSSEVGQRAMHHGNVIAAALEAKVPYIAYTSLLQADTSVLQLAAEHVQTEQLIRASGMAFTLLRNGWYIENYVPGLEATLQNGSLLGAAGEAMFAPAARNDFAAAAAAVLAGDGHEGAVYELGGDERLSLADLAATIADVSGDEIDYVDLPEAEFAHVLEGAGLPAPFAAILANSDTGIRMGHLDTASGDLSRLIGRATASVRSVLIAPIAQVALETA
ncbi:MAG: putative nucleoside-diphosphate-sugar epimerase [Thermoleophilia bacterium]|nr:putative nucleoside-diphosphate-sugar epimerase [Thermoleophilia bacterium]